MMRNEMMKKLEEIFFLLTQFFFILYLGNTLQMEELSKMFEGTEFI
jgi:hypothetical protein